MGFEKFFKNLKSKKEEPDNTIGKFEEAEQKKEKILEDFFQFLKENYLEQGEISNDDIEEIADRGEFGDKEKVEALLEKLVEKGKASKEDDKYIIDFGIDFEQDMAA